MEHSFLLREGSWRAQGEYCDAGGRRVSVSGENSVRHEARRWLFEAVLRLRGNPPQVQHNRYEIEPFSPGARSTHWTGVSPSLGALQGRFVLCGDAILSFYASPTGRYRGFECIQHAGEDRYTVRGTLLEEDKVVSTWCFDLTRETAA